MKLNPYLTPCITINSKWIKDINVRTKTIKLLEETLLEKLHDIEFGNDSLDMKQKSTGNERKTR